MQKSPGKHKKRDAIFQQHFLEDLRYWTQQDRKMLLRLLELIESIVREPFSGIGKPEPLRHMPAGTWSRRLNKEHRVVYMVFEDSISFLQARYHY